MNMLSLLAEERTASIREIQKNPSRALRGVTRVMRGSESLGVFVPMKELAAMVEGPKNIKTVRMTAAQKKALTRSDRHHKAGTLMRYDEYVRSMEASR